MKNVAPIYDLDDTIIPTRSIPPLTFQLVFEAIEIQIRDFNPFWRFVLNIL
jgi:hypothetical protein